MRVPGSRVIFRLVLALLLASGVAAAAMAADMAQAERQELEALLARLGFRPGPVDGVADERTRAAILRYQAFAALSGPGEPTRALLIELRAVEQALAAMREVAVPPGAAVAPEDSDQIAAPGPSPEAGEQLFPEKLDAPEEPEQEGKGDVDEILALLTPYKKALDRGEIAPGDLARTFNRQGRADFEQALYDRAVAQFGAAIHLDPDFAAAFHNRGVAQEAAGRRDLAAQDFERAFELGFGRLRLGGAGE